MKMGEAFERLRFVTAWPRLQVGRTGISLGCFASSGCGGLVGKVEKGLDKSRSRLGYSLLPRQCQGSGAGAGESEELRVYPGKGCSALLISGSRVKESIATAPRLLVCSWHRRAVSHFICCPGLNVKI